VGRQEADGAHAGAAGEWLVLIDESSRLVDDGCADLFGW